MALVRNSVSAREEPAELPGGDEHSLGWLRVIFGTLEAFAALWAGTFLLLYPWLDVWGSNYFSSLSPLWNNPYARGAVSGLGVVNVFIACSAISQLWRRKGS